MKNQRQIYRTRGNYNLDMLLEENEVVVDESNRQQNNYAVVAHNRKAEIPTVDKAIIRILDILDEQKYTNKPVTWRG